MHRDDLRLLDAFENAVYEIQMRFKFPHYRNTAEYWADIAVKLKEAFCASMETLYRSYPRLILRDIQIPPKGGVSYTTTVTTWKAAKTLLAAEAMGCPWTVDARANFDVHFGFSPEQVLEGAVGLSDGPPPQDFDPREAG